VGASSTFALGLALGACVLALGACEQSEVAANVGASGPRTDPNAEDVSADFGALPEFQLVDAHGQKVTLADLLGRPLVMAALYSTCPGPCPNIARSLRRLQDELADTDVLLVAVSVDPTVDTPAVLTNYAERYGADPKRWIFLTGAESEVDHLVKEGFMTAVARAGAGEAAPEGRVTHDKRLLAIDRAGHRRGWYEGDDEVQVERLKRRMLFLAKR
jgi:cytochrome oxidase Cu insertion factor (SCO1/SenC/PrrC family)